MKNKHLWFLGVLLVGFSVFLYACGLTGGGEGVEGTITGYIYAADGTTPIGGATVYLKTDSTKIATTDANGAFTLEGDWIVSGTFTLVAEKGEFKIEFTVTVTSDGSATDTGTKEVTPGETGVTVPDLGVIKGVYDSIGKVISDLGYSYTTIEVSDLDNYTYISTFEAIFINCGYGNYGTIVDVGSREANLLKFVTEEGNSLYASDWAGDVIEAIWPDAIVWYGGSVSNAKRGNSQTLEVAVVDSDLQTVLGKTTAEVYYDLGSWVVISSEGTGTDVLLTGSPEVSYDYWSSSNISSYSPRADRLRTFSETVAATLEAVPLAVKFQPGGSSKGTVIYTTFHNEAQTEDVTADALKILKDFVFTL